MATDDSQRCAMRGTCGRKGFGKELPCPYDGPPVEPDDDFRATLVAVCGEAYAHGPACCTSAQVDTLSSNLVRADAMISTCPACRNNFRDFFCSFTCSPHQSNFVNVTKTQITSSGQTAVASVDYYVSDTTREGFYDSCKDIKMAATNGYAMDLIGGGAKNGSGFLAFMGKEDPTFGSPFPIHFPSEASGDMTLYDAPPRLCSSTDIADRCSCLDCESVCPALPPPQLASQCHVGPLSCLSFTILLFYVLSVAAFLTGFVLERKLRRKRERAYERVALSADTTSNNISSPASQYRGLLGASSLAHYGTEDSQEGHERTTTRGASLLDPIDAIQPRQHKLNTLLRRAFYRLGLFCASHPWLIFAVVFTGIGLLNIGWKKFAVERNPVRLWVSPTSESRVQMETFDTEFGPFYRAEQIFVTVDSDANDTAVLTFERLQWLAEVQQAIRGLRSQPNNYRLSDVCFKPAGPRGACVVQSVVAWFPDWDVDDYEDGWEDHIYSCMQQPVLCLPDFQQPLLPQFVLGGAPPAEKEGEARDWLKSKAMVINYVVSNSLDPADIARAEEWEVALREYLTTVSENAPSEVNAKVTFQTGVSLEEELNKSTNTDLPIVVLSYLVMFFYVALTLGDGSSAGPEEDGFFHSLHTWAKGLPRLVSQRQSIALTDDPDMEPATWLPRLPRRLFVGSKFTLGLFGISLVILSVAAAAGFFSLLSVKSTLIIAEVIPFLVLAVGVDNIFILVHEVDRQGHMHGPYASLGQPTNGSFTNPMSPTQTRFDSRDSDAESAPRQLPAEERIARALAKMGPSILLSSLTETVAFALGALVPMPAVRNFALYAAGSVFINALLQVTVFVSALAIDVRRTEAGRVDCFPCIRMPSKIALYDGVPTIHTGFLARLIRRHYAPFLLRESVKAVVLVLFGGLFVASVISIQRIELGLDERLALPRDSYLIDYFNDLHEYLEIGPPVYFVVQGGNETSRPGQQELCGRFSTCEPFSLANILEAERKRSDTSFIGLPTASWVDDFFIWLNPDMDKCCRVRKADPSQFCRPRDGDSLCQPCLKNQTPAWNVTMDGLPEGPEFIRYMKQWLVTPTDENCPLGGQASYGTALALDDAGDRVEASHFRTFHTPLRTQSDFIGAFSAAHRIANDISRRTGLNVFPYSSFYVFFDQYAHIIGVTQEVLGLGLASVLIVTAVLLGSWRTGTIVTGVVALTVVNVMGVMGLWGINLNAVSVVNLVISLGIAVEFCSHVARAFMGAGVGLPVDHPGGQRERDERMWIALVDVGPSVLSGITFTKLIGMSVMALTRSKLLEIYHFRMWVTLIISGALHGLVLLPVVLSLAGGPGYTLEDADEEWMATAIRRNNRDQDYEYRPFLADSDSIVSD